MDDNLTLEDQPRRRWRYLPSFSGGGKRRRIVFWVLAPILLFILLYYPVGAFIINNIDDDPNFAPAQVEPNASRAVAMAVALINREARQHSWPANHPWFLPGAVLDNMPNYQEGIIQALRRFTQEMTDQIGRARGSSQADPDLELARSSLNYASDIWVWNISISIFPTATSPQQYKAAEQALLNYNKRLAAGTAVFDRRSDNLLATLDRIAKDVGSSSAALEQQIEQHSGDWIDFQADDRFYRTKGELYAYALLLRELGKDFDSVLKERGLQTVWANMLDNLSQASGLHPWVVVNGSPDSQVMPSHLAAEGFFLLRARAQMYEIMDILTK
jgi:hypothetical protein